MIKRIYKENRTRRINEAANAVWYAIANSHDSKGTKFVADKDAQYIIIDAETRTLQFFSEADLRENAEYVGVDMHLQDILKLQPGDSVDMSYDAFAVRIK